MSNETKAVLNVLNALDKSQMESDQLDRQLETLRKIQTTLNALNKLLDDADKALILAGIESSIGSLAERVTRLAGERDELRWVANHYRNEGD